MYKVVCSKGKSFGIYEHLKRAKERAKDESMEYKNIKFSIYKLIEKDRKIIYVPMGSYKNKVFTERKKK
jgi:hypothetical protein